MVNNFHILERVCASTPDGHHFMIIHAKNRQTGELVWAIGDDYGGAITSADFIRNNQINYRDVCIQEFLYQRDTPEFAGGWRTLIEELIRHTLKKYIEHDGMVQVYPQWLPEEVEFPIERDIFLKGADRLILYGKSTVEVVYRP